MARAGAAHAGQTISNLFSRCLARTVTGSAERERKSERRRYRSVSTSLPAPMARQQLGLYRAKRDFEKTNEPTGSQTVARAEYPRFVIQKHAATRLHYDLRLEVDGVFKSWAVTKGPSIDPADKRLAVEVEDHPLDYGDFEGTIPKGEYGGGTVMLWDRGFWAVDDGKTPAEALRRGELKFTLAGQKLKGSWVLVRMRHDRDSGKRTNWLLIKHRDGYQKDGDHDAVLAQDRSVASGRSMDQITAGKGRGPKPFMRGKGKAADPRAIWHSAPDPPARQITAKSKRSTAAMPEFIPPQLCKLVSRPPAGDDWVHEIKFDGYRMQLRIENGVATLRTRKGLDWTEKFAAIAAAAAKLPDAIIDGEAVAFNHNGAPDFGALQAALSEGNSQNIIYFAFDLLFEGGKDLRDLALADRKKRLKALLARDAATAKVIRYVDHLTDAGDAVLKSACQMDLEGIVSKRLSATYQSVRSDSWTKAKCRGGHEVVIGGWSGSATKVRSLLAGVFRGDHLVHVGRVGTGFNARNTPELLAKLNAVKSRESPFGGEGAPRRESGVNWARPELVAEIEFAGWTCDGMVREAAFKGLREDKPAAEVRAEEPMAPDKIDIETPRPLANLKVPVKVAQSDPSDTGSKVLGVTISKPGKEFWPAEGDNAAVTKLDLARYFERIGPWMLEHIKGRPCSIIRAPDGLKGEMFFQRHAMKGISNLVTLTTVPGDRKPYVQIDRHEALIAMAQIAAVELHPWNCQPGQPDVPGRLIFDLDPGPDVPFTTTVTAARELSERLQALGLVTFCKTTGGKGLHVVTPLKATPKAPVDWPQAKAFAQAVCTGMANDNPKLFLVNMSKRLREGRIFLDYLRNDRMSTAVAPLSPRIRPGAPVSMPLHWSQVRAGLDPMRFTIWSVPALLAKSKPWVDYGDAERPLAPAIEALITAKGRCTNGRRTSSVNS
jgi:bifunctional non-homologous end joining protein LigD